MKAKNETHKALDVLRMLTTQRITDRERKRPVIKGEVNERLEGEITGLTEFETVLLALMAYLEEK